MDWQLVYERAKAAHRDDPGICRANRELIAKFFDFEEYKLKRQNGLLVLDPACFKTLCGYAVRLRNVNRWFGDKPWKELSRRDIKRVYDGLEDGTIRTARGQPYRDRKSYYSKIFRSKPFGLAGKADLAKQVIEFSTAQRSAVRFLPEAEFRKLIRALSSPTHLLLFWLAWDIGENISTLLSLNRYDFIPQPNRYTGEPEYIIHLPASKIKRARLPRGEPTLYAETVRYASSLLARPAGDADRPLFPFQYAQAWRLMHAAASKSGAVTMPYSERPRWKDLRSGMACHLLRSGWTRDEVNSRLGHTPGSKALDVYINFLALDRDRPKQRLTQDLLAAPSRAVRRSKIRFPCIVPSDQHSLLLHELKQTRKKLDLLRAEMSEVLRAVRAGRQP